jgi:3-methylcrotonyl-CoA carboxylase alpha subunit
LTLDGRRCNVTAVGHGDELHLFMDGRRDVFTHADPLAFRSVSAGATAGGLRAPMPGRVIELIAAPGAKLAKGAPLLVLEAMKIEHTILAPSAGTLRGFKVAAGEQVGEGMELVDFVAEGLHADNR